jgi:hypothetical protein
MVKQNVIIFYYNAATISGNVMNQLLVENIAD